MVSVWCILHNVQCRHAGCNVQCAMRNVQIRLLGGKAGAAAVLGSFPLCATMLYIISLGSAIVVMATKDNFCFFIRKPR